MSELIVVAFKDEFTADEVLLQLQKMQREFLVDLEDAAIVVRREDGNIKIKQAHNLVAAGAVGGSFWGLLIGLIFLNPLAGLLVGAGVGAITGMLSDIGIDDEFIKDLGNQIQPGTSALFILARKVTPDKVIGELERFEGTVLHTSLTHEDEEELREALAAKKASLDANRPGQ
jgi:uncharacterized membrane protein